MKKYAIEFETQRKSGRYIEEGESVYDAMGRCYSRFGFNRKTGKPLMLKITYIGEILGDVK